MPRPPDHVPSTGPPQPGPRRTHITREGWYWLFGCAVLIAIGLVKAINLLALVGSLMVVVWVLSLVSVARRTAGLRGKHFVDEPVFAGTPAAVGAEVHNPGTKTRVGLALEDQAAGHHFGWFIPTLAGRGTGRLQQEVTWARRGVARFGPLVVSTSLPFGLVRGSRVLAPEQEVIVLPRLGRLHRGRLRQHLAQVNLTLGRTGPQARRHPAAQADLHGLRSFRSGDSTRWIHWRTTARKGELMVREFEEAPNDNLILVLDPQAAGSGGTAVTALPPGPASSSPLLEEAVSMAATICWEWCRQTGDRLVLAIAGANPVVHAGVTGRDFALRLLECLAVEAGNSVTDEQALLDRLAGVPLPPGPVLGVSARPSRLADVLTEGLRRPVAWVAVSDPQGYDFYERTTGHVC